MIKQKITRKKRKSRAGMVQLGVWVREDLYLDFQHKAIDLNMNVGILVEQAMQEYCRESQLMGLPYTQNPHKSLF